MYRIAPSPVKDVAFGTALKISLDNYYDILKQQSGGLKVEERLQLKLASNSIDVSEDKPASQHGYKWFSYYNLVGKSDRAISPMPIDGEIQTGLESLASVYALFLRKLRTFVVQKALSSADQKVISDLDIEIEALKDDAEKYAAADHAKWQTVAPANGWLVGDMGAYVQWSNRRGHLRKIEQLDKEIARKTFDQQTIIKRTSPSPADQAIIDAEFLFEGPAVRLRYPMYPDYEYPNGDAFNVSYLALLPTGTTALFDDRHSIAFDKTIDFIRTSKSGTFTATLDRQTQESSSISTDWSGGGNVGYGPISVRADASEHQKIQTDFLKATGVTLAADAVIRVELNIPWMDATLFNHEHVRDNPHDFIEFFGSSGSLLYYPTALIVVRGFSATFNSSQNWTYDYERRFSASAGGGFNAFGVSFGASGSYSKDEKEHQVDVSTTKLTLSDSPETVRFVGYAVKKNNTVALAVEKSLKTKGL